MYNEKDEYDRVTRKRDNDYENYLNKVSALESEYESLRDKYNGEISIINNERVSMREEIRKLYEFLKTIGGTMGDKISIFDFNKEVAPLHYVQTTIQKVDAPHLEESHPWLDALIKTITIHNNNKKKVINYETRVDEQKIKFDKDLQERKNNNQFLTDANTIAEIYKNIVVIVRDAVRDKIIPEMGLIKAFLYADAIRERVLDGEDPRNVTPGSIEEYQGSKQDIHYQFVKNVFDFYNIATNFFKRTILTDMIADQVVSEEEKSQFNIQVEAIKRSVKQIEEKKVL